MEDLVNFVKEFDLNLKNDLLPIKVCNQESGIFKFNILLHSMSLENSVEKSLEKCKCGALF